MMRIVKIGLFGFLAMVFTFGILGCSAEEATTEVGTGGESMSTLEFSSPAFGNNEGIPEIYTCKGKNISPELTWGEPPTGTQSFVLIMDDPDAPLGNWDHWILFNLPAATRGLAENIQTLPVGAKIGKNSWGKTAYGGPCPPGGARHRYFFKLYALDQTLDLDQGATKKKIEKAMVNHVLAQAEWIGIYKP